MGQCQLLRCQGDKKYPYWLGRGRRRYETSEFLGGDIIAGGGEVGKGFVFGRWWDCGMVGEGESEFAPLLGGLALYGLPLLIATPPRPRNPEVP